MDRLWTPWRYSYITEADAEDRKGVPPELQDWPASLDTHCVFCNMLASVDYAVAQGMEREAAEKAAHIVSRGAHCFTCLNAYPYTSGHLLIVPYNHQASLSAIPLEAADELIRTARHVETAIQTLYHPDGLNLGMNLGKAAGAGVANHLHLHILPRWVGDTNFMTVTAETRVLPEVLDVTWTRLRTILGQISM